VGTVIIYISVSTLAKIKYLLSGLRYYNIRKIEFTNVAGIMKQRAAKPINLHISKFSMPLIICLFGIIIGASYYENLWKMGPDGLSIVSHSTPYWDFNNLWTGGRLALGGHVDWLFDTEKYRAEMRNLLGPNLPMLLIAAPLAMFPPIIAYIIWTLGSLLLLYIAIKPLKLPPLLQLVILLSPAVFINTLLGQNGTFISALLIMGLYHAPKKPVLAGICIGLMTVKPQFGVLLPFLLIASRNWTAFISASVTALGMVILTSLFFGFDVWSNFLGYTQPMMRGIMEAPYPQSYHTNAVPVFIFVRAIGAGLFGAYVFQAVVSVLAIIIGVKLWHQSTNIDHIQRVALTCVLVMLATPYAYTYDMVALGAAIVIIFATSERLVWFPVFAPIWLFPLFNHVIISQHPKLSFGAICILAAFILLSLTLHFQKLKTLR